MVAVDTDVGILLHIRPAVLEPDDGAVLAIDSVSMHISSIVHMGHGVIDQACGNAINTGYGVVVGLAVVAFFAAAIGDSAGEEKEEYGLFHRPK